MPEAAITPGCLATLRNPPVSVAGVCTVLRMQTVKVKGVPTEYMLVQFPGSPPTSRAVADYKVFVPWHHRKRGL